MFRGRKILDEETRGDLSMRITCSDELNSFFGRMINKGLHSRIKKISDFYVANRRVCFGNVMDKFKKYDEVTVMYFTDCYTAAIVGDHEEVKKKIYSIDTIKHEIKISNERKDVMATKAILKGMVYSKLSILDPSLIINSPNREEYRGPEMNCFEFGKINGEEFEKISDFDFGEFRSENRYIKIHGDDGSIQSLRWVVVIPGLSTEKHLFVCDQGFVKKLNKFFERGYSVKCWNDAIDMYSIQKIHDQ